MSAPRRATAADAAALARIQVRAWHHAFADVVYPEDTPTVADQTAYWEAALEGEVDTLLVDVGGAVRAFVAFGAAPASGAGAAQPGEITALFVDPVAQGAGLGGILLTRAEDELRALGHSEALLWTLEAAPAREWYERRGWRRDGPVVPQHGLLGVPEVRYRRSLVR